MLPVPTYQHSDDQTQRGQQFLRVCASLGAVAAVATMATAVPALALAPVAQTAPAAAVLPVPEAACAVELNAAVPWRDYPSASTLRCPFAALCRGRWRLANLEKVRAHSIENET